MLWADLPAICRQGNVSAQELSVLLKQVCQIWAANLLLTLQQKLHRQAIKRAIQQ